jgi:limonene-1,2-epoxide hydrolase
LLLGACTPAPVDNDGPIQTVRAFVVALEDRDASAIIALIEPTDWRREIGPELRTYLGYLATIAIVDETYAVERHQGDTAIVRVTGTLQYALAESGAGGERPFDLQIEVVRVDGVWYLRSLQLPQPGV